MALGNYWTCVLPEGAETPLQRIGDGTTTIARNRFPSWRLQPEGPDLGAADFLCMADPDGDIRSVVHLIKTDNRHGFYLHSAFPWLAVGAPVRLTIRSVRTDHFGLEGFIETEGGSWSITFFDPMFALNKSKYRVGAECEFALSGVSLNLKRAAPAQEGRFLAADAEAPDHVLFRGELKGMRVTSFLGSDFWVFRVALMKSVGAELSLNIYMGRDRIPLEEVPSAGELVTGTLWLQGHLVGNS